MKVQHQARKRFGQNFLTDEAIIDRIAASIDPREDQHLVEIGPGLGALTGALLDSGCRLDAIELDRDLALPLLASFSVYPRFRLHSADALSFDFASLAEEASLRVVGNLPYNISTPLIFHLLTFSELLQDMHFMLQLEVVERLTAEPGSKHWGRLAIMTQYRCNAELLFEVPPTAFEPAPKVQSAIVRLEPLPAAARADCDEADLDRVVRAAFAQRRKTLRNNLRGLFDADALAALGLDAGARAETLALEDFVRLARAAAAAGPAE